MREREITVGRRRVIISIAISSSSKLLYTSGYLTHWVNMEKMFSIFFIYKISHRK